jgi:hypothetical protein
MRRWDKPRATIRLAPGCCPGRAGRPPRPLPTVLGTGRLSGHHPAVIGTGRLSGRHLDRAACAIPTVLARPVIGPTFEPVVRPAFGPVDTGRGAIVARRPRRTRRLRGGHPGQSPGERDGHQRRRDERSDTHGHLLRSIRVDRTEPSRASVVLPERIWFLIRRRYARPVAESFGERPVALKNTSTAAPIASQSP